MEVLVNQPTYSFDSFLQARKGLNDLDNPFLEQLFNQLLGDDYEAVHKKLVPFVDKLSTEWRESTNEIARPENHPKLRHYNGYNERIDSIIRPQESHQLTAEVFNSGLFSDAMLPYEGIMKRYFLHGNGEAGITCPLACTDGLVALIESFYDEVPNEVKEIYLHCKNGINGQFAVGAQFMSEIQGGSNIPANVLQAVPEQYFYRLYGNKFFCSAVHADYAVVTARVDGTDNIACFIVPTWLPGDKQKEKRNGHRVNRLKWKLGTTELPSGEIDYDGAVAYRIGPEDRGVALAVSIVLTRSRLDIGFASASFVMRGAREATLYARFRHVFDRKVDQFPMASAQLEDLMNAAKRMSATAFMVYKRFIDTQRYELDSVEAFATRELILLQKIYASKEAVDQLRLAISIFGGHGAIEDFSSIPRLFRDSMVNELWEGPRNVLLAQVYRDIHKFSKKRSMESIIKAIFPNLSEAELSKFVSEIIAVMKIDLTGAPTAENRQAARKWEAVWGELFYIYQQSIVDTLRESPILQEDVLAQV